MGDPDGQAAVGLAHYRLQGSHQTGPGPHELLSRRRQLAVPNVEGARSRRQEVLERLAHPSRLMSSTPI